MDKQIIAFKAQNTCFFWIVVIKCFIYKMLDLIEDSENPDLTALSD